MKKYKLLLALTATTSALIPLVGCNKTQASTSQIRLVGSKDITTPYAISRFQFFMPEKISQDRIKFKIYNEVKQSCEIYDKYIYIDEDEHPNDLYLFVIFDQEEYGKYTFDLDFVIDVNTTITFRDLSITLNPETHILPKAALIIEDGVLKGLNPDFTIASYYDTLDIPNGITSVADNAFKDQFSESAYSNITTIKLNQQLTNIGANAFDGCNSITTLDVSEIEESDEKCPLTIGKDAFINWEFAEGSKIIYKTERVKYELLDNQLCDQGLEKEWFDNTTIRSTRTSDFKISSDGKTVNGVTWDSIENAPRHITSLINQLRIPDSIENIADNAFYDATNSATLIPSNIEYLYLPSTLITIGENGFRDSSISKTETSLSGHIELPETLTTIGKYGFANTKINGVKFNANLTSLGDYAFYGCSSLNFIDVTELTSKPAGWSEESTFANISDSGEIKNKFSSINEWTTYFVKWLDLTKWSLVDQIDILAGEYVPTVQPITGQSWTKDQLKLELHKAFTQKTAIIIDEIVYTLIDCAKTSGLSEFKVKFTNASYNAGNLSLTIKYTAKLDSDSYTGTWTINSLSINTYEDISSTKPVMYFTFKSLFGDSTSMTIKETKNTETEKIYHVDYESQITDDNLGVILPTLKLFDTGATKTFKINSRYLGDCTIAE